MEDDNVVEYPDNNLSFFEIAMLIELAKIYDMLMLIALNNGDGERVEELLEMHKRGQFYCPPPALEVKDADNRNS